MLCGELEQDNLYGLLSKCHEVRKYCYQDLLLRIENIKSSMCLRFSRCHISIIHFSNAQTDRPLLRPRPRGESSPVKAALALLMFTAEAQQGWG